MGYSGARGGLDAILAAESLVRRSRDDADAPWATTEQIVRRFRLAVDRVMGEGGLYDEATAADAFRQAEGDPLEAAHLVRAHRATLPRLAVSEPADPDESVVLRRVVPAYRSPDGPQLLGRTSDYTGRLLEREGTGGPNGNGNGNASRNGDGHAPDGAAVAAAPAGPPAGHGDGHQRSPVNHAVTGETNGDAAVADWASRRPRRFLALLRELDLVVDHRPEAADDPEPVDVARRPARPPAPRSAILSAMARAETGSLVGLWYRSILGPDGDIHEVTLGEVRHARMPLRVRHPHTGRPVGIGDVRVSEAEAIEDLDGAEEDRTRLDVGYGLCFGHNERKAIAMANLDIACRRFGRTGPLQQLLLLTTDGLDSGGFLEHLKLPHYVTFRSIVERKLAMREAAAAGRADPRLPDPAGVDCR